MTVGLDRSGWNKEILGRQAQPSYSFVGLDRVRGRAMPGVLVATNGNKCHSDIFLRVGVEPHLLLLFSLPVLSSRE